MKVTTIGQGQTLFKEGSKSDAVYFLKEGEVEVFRHDPKTGKKIILQVLGPESIIGTLGFLLGANRSATATCLTEVKCIEIKEQQRDTLLKQVPSWMKTLLKDMSGIILGQNEKFLDAQRQIVSLENKVKSLTRKQGENNAEEASNDTEEASKDTEETSKSTEDSSPKSENNTNEAEKKVA